MEEKEEILNKKMELKEGRVLETERLLAIKIQEFAVDDKKES
jgi:hypothetical protein